MRAPGAVASSYSMHPSAWKGCSADFASYEFSEDRHSPGPMRAEDIIARLREETVLDRLGEDLVRMVSETLQPEHVFFFLRPDHDPQPQPQARHPPRPPWWYTCNITYKILEALEGASLSSMK